MMSMEKRTNCVRADMHACSVSDTGKKKTGVRVWICARVCGRCRCCRCADKDDPSTMYYTLISEAEREGRCAEGECKGAEKKGMQNKRNVRVRKEGCLASELPH